MADVLLKDASNYADPNPVEAEHVMSQLRSNFPEPAIAWVKRSRWIGPVQIPWERINDHNIDSWAASHQLDQVNRFANNIKKKIGNTNPSILIQAHDTEKCDIIDGHHRALAHKKLNEPVLAYVGFVHARDKQAALETHAMQFHAGSDPRNKREKVSKESVNYRLSEHSERCGNCAMFKAGSCDLVLGHIEAQDVCDRWLPANSEKSAQTPELSVTHAPIGHEGVWHSKHPPMQLPAYIQQIRNALMRAGHDEQSAHALAVGAVKRWAKGDLKWGPKRHVTPEVVAASQEAVRQWEDLRANHP